MVYVYVYDDVLQYRLPTQLARLPRTQSLAFSTYAGKREGQVNVIIDTDIRSVLGRICNSHSSTTVKTSVSGLYVTTTSVLCI